MQATVISGTTKSLSGLLSVPTCLALILLALISIQEITARVEFLSILEEKLIEMERSNSEAISNKSELPYYPAALDGMAELASMVETLTAVGSGTDQETLAGIRNRYAPLVATRFSGDTPKTPQDERFLSRYLFGGIGDRYYQLGSRGLLAISVMACAGIGATTTFLRTKRPFSWKALISGVAAGFIVFLGLNGGNDVFFLRAAEGGPHFNPYSCGFLGFISGAFSERTFDFLKGIAERVFDQLEKAVGKDGS